jgi:hypothetical protein
MFWYVARLSSCAGRKYSARPYNDTGGQRAAEKPSPSEPCRLDGIHERGADVAGVKVHWLDPLLAATQMGGVETDDDVCVVVLLLNSGYEELSTE